VKHWLSGMPALRFGPAGTGKTYPVEAAFPDPMDALSPYRYQIRIPPRTAGV